MSPLVFEIKFSTGENWRLGPRRVGRREKVKDRGTLTYRFTFLPSSVSDIDKYLVGRGGGVVFFSLFFYLLWVSSYSSSTSSFEITDFSLDFLSLPFFLPYGSFLYLSSFLQVHLTFDVQEFLFLSLLLFVVSCREVWLNIYSPIIKVFTYGWWTKCRRILFPYVDLLFVFLFGVLETRTEEIRRTTATNPRLSFFRKRFSTLDSWGYFRLWVDFL